MSDREEIRAVLRKWVSAATVCSPVDGAAADMLTDRALNELMPLLAVPDEHPVLAEVDSEPPVTGGHAISVVHCVIERPPGTRVRVVADVD